MLPKHMKDFYLAELKALVDANVLNDYYANLLMDIRTVIKAHVATEKYHD